MQTLTRSSPAKASEPRIALVGHITVERLRRELTRTDAANGFGNRFLWICVRRSKLLPEGGDLAPEDLERRAAQGSHRLGPAAGSPRALSVATRKSPPVARKKSPPS
jgi:hypothetical protein